MASRRDQGNWPEDRLVTSLASESDCATVAPQAVLEGCLHNETEAFSFRSALGLVLLLFSQPCAARELFDCEETEVIDEGWSISLMDSEAYLGRGECVSDLTRDNRSATVFDGRRG